MDAFNPAHPLILIQTVAPQPGLVTPPTCSSIEFGRVFLEQVTYGIEKTPPTQDGA